jgi:hypothetical protein
LWRTFRQHFREDWVAGNLHFPFETTIMWIKLFGTIVALTARVAMVEAKMEDPLLLVGNSRGDKLVGYYEDGSVMEFISGLTSPDHIRIAGDYLYVTVGDTIESSAMYRMNLETGDVVDDFLKGGAPLRPYGFDFYKDRIYVASFLTDEIIIYDMYTGAYIGVFATGDGTEEGLVNGPNHIAIYEDKLYLTTQGSVATDGSPVYGLASQIAVFDMHDGTGSVFVPQPEPNPEGLGFISMLGIQIYCTTACYAYTTDFAGGLRVYTLEGELVYEASTSYEPGAITGALSIVDGQIFIPGSVDPATDGIIMRFSAVDGAALPSMMMEGALFAGPSDMLIRPIGILALEAPKMSKGKGGGMPMSGKGKMKMMMMSGKGKGKGTMRK